MSAVAETLTALRTAIARIEGEPFQRPEGRIVVPLGHDAADAALQGGLRRGVLHEVLARDASHGAAATGFVAALAVRMAGRRTVLWIMQDLAATEGGEPFATGLMEIGLDPARMIVMRAADVEGVLRAGWEALQCPALGTVVLEPWGKPKILDLVASRRLALAAMSAGVTAVLLRAAADPMPGAAMTRWVIAPAPSPTEDWGAPVFDAVLQRNRIGPAGRWAMEWDCDACLFREPMFREPTAHPLGLAAEALHRPARTAGTPG